MPSFDRDEFERVRSQMIETASIANAKIDAARAQKRECDELIRDQKALLSDILVPRTRRSRKQGAE